MTEQELRYFALCGPLEDAIEYLDTGKPERARELLTRLLRQAQAELPPDPEMR